MTQTTTRPFAVVTGGSNGIGFELVKQFLANGYHVLIAGEDDQHTADAVRILQTGEGQVDSWAGDLGREDQVDAFYDALPDKIAAQVHRGMSEPGSAG